jgi:DNA-binding protein HU-beta
MTQRQAENAVNALFSVIRQALSEHDKVTLRRFGEFTVRHKRERAGRNPKNGEPAVIKARSVVQFRAGDTLKREVNNV